MNMKPNVLLSLLVLAGSLVATAQQLPARRSSNYDPTARQGQFDLRAQVDGSVDFYIQGDRITYQVLSGSPPVDAGSEYTQPIPRARFASFTVEKKDGRGRVELRQEPSPRNNYTALIHIEDPSGGSARYHARLHWEIGDPYDAGETIRLPGARPSPWESGRRGEGRSRSDLPGERLSSPGYQSGRISNDRSGELEFRGRIDFLDEAVLRIRGDEVYAETPPGRQIRDVRFNFSQPIPTMRLRGVELEQLDGRGELDLVEKPWEGNGYTAVIVIRDPSGRDDYYHFRLRWRR